MPYTLPVNERLYLRELAKRQAELAALPIMAVRQQRWTDMNDAVPGARPPFAIESWTFARDFMPESLFKCKSDYGRRLETGFLYNIRHHEILNDDHVCPNTLDMGWHVWVNEFGFDISADYAKDAEGVTTGYHFHYPIADLCDGFDMVKPATFGVNRESTMEEKAFLEETFGDIMPVRITSGTYGNNYLTYSLVKLMSMDTFFTAMYDCPETLHALMAQLRDSSINVMQWAEREGLLVLNNGNQCSCGTCFNYTTLLPKGESIPGQVKLTDMWTGMNSQETVGVSPELFHEFCFPYYRDIAALCGLVYWGCCEPVDPIWEMSLSKLPNLKAVSISRWANQQYMVDVLEGTGIVFSRKPDPNLLSVDRILDEDAWRAEIRGTLQVLDGRNVPAQLIVRDVYTMHGNLGKAQRAVEIALEEIDSHH